MAERYDSLFLSDEKYYMEGSSVVYAAGRLLKDTKYNRVVAQLKFRNISKKKIRAVKIQIYAKDSFGKTVKGVSDYSYTDLNANAGDEWGQDVAITMPDITTRVIDVVLKSVVFENGNVWNNSETTWNILSKQNSISDELKDKELIKQFKLEYGEKSQNLYLEEHGIWHCVCGNINLSSDEECFACKAKKELLATYDLETLKIKTSERLEEERIKREEARLKYEHKKEAERKEAEQRAKKNKRIAIVISAIVVAISAFFVIWNNVIVPNKNYKKALALMEEKNYAEAIDAFEKLDGYKNSEEKIDECRYNDAVILMETGNTIEAYEAFISMKGYKDSEEKANSLFFKLKVEKLNHAKVGDYVLWGEYEQDNDKSNGKEDVEWLVLEVKDGRVLLISKYGLECLQYNEKNVDVTWETCTLRNWLNDTFLNTAFSENEKALIHEFEVSADENPVYYTSAGNMTQDQIFLLSIAEAEMYFSSDTERVCEATAYAIDKGAYVVDKDKCYLWWLRTPGHINICAAGVRGETDIDEVGQCVVYVHGAVRPAMWIDLNY